MPNTKKNMILEYSFSEVDMPKEVLYVGPSKFHQSTMVAFSPYTKPISIQVKNAGKKIKQR
jgi:hypothetical protein